MSILKSFSLDSNESRCPGDVCTAFGVPVTVCVTDETTWQPAGRTDNYRSCHLL